MPPPVQTPRCAPRGRADHNSHNAARGRAGAGRGRGRQAGRGRRGGGAGAGAGRGSDPGRVVRGPRAGRLGWLCPSGGGRVPGAHCPAGPGAERAGGQAFIHSLCVPPSVPLCSPAPGLCLCSGSPSYTSSFHSLSLSLPLSSLTSSPPDTPLPFIYCFTAHLEGRSSTWNETVNQTGSLVSWKTPWLNRSDCWTASLCLVLCSLGSGAHAAPVRGEPQSGQESRVPK